jgi:hypothetical protein
MSRAWYQLALAPSRSSTAIDVVAAQGDHLGDAVAKVAKAYPRRAVMAARVCPAAPLGEAVGRQRDVVEQPAIAELVGVPFRWPLGVIPDVWSLARLAGVTPGYTVHHEAEGLMMEAHVEADQVTDVFLGLVERLAVADNLEVRLMHHFEDHGTTEVWLTPRIGVKKILRFVDDHDRDLVNNGFVELAVYLRQERSTLRLTEHKTVMWTSVDRSTEARTAQALAALGVPAKAAVVALASVPHFHVRPHDSRDRAALARYLQRQRMRLVDRIDRTGISLSVNTAANPR